MRKGGAFGTALSLRATLHTMRYALRRALPKDPWWHIVGLSFGLVFVLMLTVARLAPTQLDLLDFHIEKLVAPLQTQPYIELFLAITILGSALGVTLVATGSAYILRAKRRSVLELFLALILAGSTMRIAKAFVERARPETITWVDSLTSFSFPSGHATLATTVYGFLSLMLYRRAKTNLGRVLSIGFGALIIGLICLSRLVLSYHYFTDVVAGVLLGLFWLSVVHMFPQRT